MRLTIVLTNHNRPKIILPVIESIFAQKLNAIELDVLIIDDASEQRIDPKDLERYGDKITIARSDINIGVQAARNMGAGLAKGDFILFSDDDDPFIDQALQKAFDLIFGFSGWERYDDFCFPKSNAMHLPMEEYFVYNEQRSLDYYNNLAHLGGDFTYIYKKEFFVKNPEFFAARDENRFLGGESLGFATSINMKIHTPVFFKHAIVQVGVIADRLTDLDNAFKKAKQFAALQLAEINDIEQSGYRDKIPNYYNRRVKGLFTYLLLDNQKLEALKTLKKYDIGFFNKLSLFPLLFLPAKVVNVLLKLFRRLRRLSFRAPSLSLRARSHRHCRSGISRHCGLDPQSSI